MDSRCLPQLLPTWWFDQSFYAYATREEDASEELLLATTVGQSKASRAANVCHS